MRVRDREFTPQVERLAEYHRVTVTEMPPSIWDREFTLQLERLAEYQRVRVTKLHRSTREMTRLCEGED